MLFDKALSSESKLKDELYADSRKILSRKFDEILIIKNTSEILRLAIEDLKCDIGNINLWFLEDKIIEEITNETEEF